MSYQYLIIYVRYIILHLNTGSSFRLVGSDEHVLKHNVAPRLALKHRTLESNCVLAWGKAKCTSHLRSKAHHAFALYYQI